METTLRVYDRAGARLGNLPWSSLSRTKVRNAQGALTGSAPKSEFDPALFDGERYLRVAVNGIEAPEWYVLNEDGDDDADEGGDAREVSIGALGAEEILEWGTVYSWEYSLDEATITAAVVAAADRRAQAQKAVTDAEVKLRQAQATGQQALIDAAQSDLDDANIVLTVSTQDLSEAQARQIAGRGSVMNLDPTYGFAAATPGAMLKTLIDGAQARGCFPHLSYSFTAELDSAGQPWPYNFARTYDVGITVGKVLAGMVEDGWVDYEMVGFRLDLYVPDTVLAEDRPDYILRLGQGVTQAPRKRTRKGTRSVIFANGAEGAAVEIADAESLAKYGRREGYEGRSGITDYGTLTSVTEVSVKRAKDASESVTLEIDPYALPADTPPLPRPGGYIRYDQRRLSATELEPMRIMSIAWSYGDDPKVSVELNDLWLDTDIKRGRQIDALLNGSSANERVPQTDPGDDHVAPGPVQAVSLVSGPYVDPTGQVMAQMTATWTEVTADADGTAINDLRNYELQWKQPEINNGVFGISTPNVVHLWQWSPVVAGTPIFVRVRALDRYGNPGEWSDWATITTGVDETAPPRPAAPDVGNYLGLLRVAWDGTFTDGAARPGDLDYIEVHVSSVDDFSTEDDPRPIEEGGTLAGTVYAPGDAVFIDTPYQQQRFGKLVAVDTTGNRSPASDQDSGATGQVVEADVFDGAIGTAKLSDLAVKTAKIDLLAVNTAQVGAIEVGKLVAGTLTAQVILGNRIATGTRGQGQAVVELNSLGIYRWSATDEQTVAIDDQGVLLVGQYKTNTSGRRIEMGASGTRGRIDFWSASGVNAFVQAYTENNASAWEAIQFGIQMPGTTEPLWNRINYNSDEYANYRAGTHEFIYRGGEKFHVMEAAGFAGSADYSAERMSIENYKTSFSFGTGSGVVELKTGNASQSAQVQLGTGNGSAAKMQLLGDSRGLWFEFVEWTQAIWIGLRAAAFEVNSDARNKSDIRDANLSHVSLVNSARVRDYLRPQPTPAELDEHGKLTGRAAKRRTVATPARREIGLVAQEAPAVIVNGDPDTGMGIDLYRMTTVLWGAVQELDGRLAAIEKGGNK